MKAVTLIADWDPKADFKLGYKETPKANLGLEKNMLRYKLMREENEEYLDAATNGDLVEVTPEKFSEQFAFRVGFKYFLRFAD